MNMLNKGIFSILLAVTALMACGGGGGEVATAVGMQMGGARQGIPLNLISMVSTLAGTGMSGSLDAIGTAATFKYPSNITTDGVNLYVTDSGNNKIRKVVIATGQVSTLAGSGSIGSTNAIGITASFNAPSGITTDGLNLYVADTYNHTIRKIAISTGEVSTLAGSSGVAGFADGIGTAASFIGPRGLTTDGTNLYVADTGNNEIRKIVIATTEVSTLAGLGVPGSMDGVGSAATFNYPAGITTDGTNLYVADVNNSVIRKIEIVTAKVSTFAGPGSLGSGDGIGSAASFGNPEGITTDGTNLYVADTANNKIRKIVISTSQVTTLAGSGVQGSIDATGTTALFNMPNDITTDGKNLYVADNGNHKIRKIQ
jgi:NHL repeat